MTTARESVWLGCPSRAFSLYRAPNVVRRVPFSILIVEQGYPSLFFNLSAFGMEISLHEYRMFCKNKKIKLRIVRINHLSYVQHLS